MSVPPDVEGREAPGPMSQRISSRKSARVRARRGALTRDQVLAQALILLDRDGVAALSMRRLAEHLQVSPMALYNHVADKQDLLQGVARRILDRMSFPIDDPDWRQRIRACFRELRNTCLKHPGVVRLLETIDDPPLSVFRPMEITLAALKETALDREDAVRAYFLLMNFVLGQVSYEARGPFKGLDPAETVKSGRLESTGFTHIEHAVPLERWDFERAFEFGLSTILAGLSSNE
ncbi:MAG TPA: TetR/AcrR family transcriptional regulator [Allosphingosinicella sp.]|jgi:AcrR family transcriptional regulator